MLLNGGVGEDPWESLGLQGDPTNPLKRRSYVKRTTSPGLMHDTGCLGLVHWDDPEGWYGEGGGRGVQVGEHVDTHSEFMLMYGKTNTIL